MLIILILWSGSRVRNPAGVIFFSNIYSFYSLVGGGELSEKIFGHPVFIYSAVRFRLSGPELLNLPTVLLIFFNNFRMAGQSVDLFLTFG